LDAGWRQDEPQRGIAAPDNVKNIGQRRAGRRSHDADAFRKLRNRAFAPGIEKPFGGQFLFEPFERGLQSSDALRLNIGHPQLILAARLIDRQFTA
jgi:hypothetical protein